MTAFAPGLLVSVRSAAEAHAALAGGAGLIDVKEPSRGPLGRADDVVVAAVLDAVGGRCPVSAALGELADDEDRPPPEGLSYVKWGLAGGAADWQAALTRRFAAARSAQVVVAAYADWQCAAAPAVDEVCAFALACPGRVLLVDTCCKEASRGLGRRPTLLDWLAVRWLEELCERCRRAGVRVALAGSLGFAEIAALLGARPDWFAVRGTVCGDGDRGGSVERDRVAALVQTIRANAQR